MKLKALLEQVTTHLETDFNKKAIETLVTQSGVVSKRRPANKGFDLLLEVLGENKDNYVFFTSDKTQKETLSRAISKTDSELEFPIATDVQTIKEYTALSEWLVKHQKQLL